jgi:hypothetical protein
VCTILVAWRAGAAETLVLAANRDEFRGRPADEPAAIAPGVFAGRDRRAGGTWLAVGPSGLAAITNIAGAEPRDGAPSRGMLPLLALRGELPASFAPWSPFNLLVADAAGLRVIVHRGAPVPAETHRLAPGVHAIVNEPYGSAVSARARRAAVLAAGGDLPDFAQLADHGEHGDDGLCHHGDAYGTVSATRVVLDGALRALRYAHASGLPCTAPARDLTAEARRVTNPA